MIAAACGERGLGREASGRRAATTVAVEAAAPCPAAQRVRADGARPDPFPAAAAQCVWPGCAATAAKRHGATALVPALAQRRCNGGAATAVRRRGAFGLATLRRGGAASLVLALVRLRCNDGAMARSIWSGGAATAARRRCATALVRPLPGGAARSARWLCNSGTTARRDRARPGPDHRIVLLSLKNWKY